MDLTSKCHSPRDGDDVFSLCFIRDHVTIQQLARTRLNSATLQLEMDTIQMSSEEMEVSEGGRRVWSQL